MSKKKSDMYQQDEAFDFENVFEDIDELAEYEQPNNFDDFIEHFIQITHHEMDVALELTKLIHSSPKDEATVMATYKRTLASLREDSPLQQLWQHMNCDEGCEN